jgi:hypothetical protein
MCLYAGWPMYGVVCATPPQNPAIRVENASASSMSRVE